MSSDPWLSFVFESEAPSVLWEVLGGWDLYTGLTGSWSWLMPLVAQVFTAFIKNVPPPCSQGTCVQGPWVGVGGKSRQWHPTPVLLPGKSCGWRSLVGCSPWRRGRVGHDWATSLSLFTFMHWRRKWQPTPVFLPEESQGRGSLVGCCLWGRTESDTTEAT